MSPSLSPASHLRRHNKIKLLRYVLKSVKVWRAESFDECCQEDRHFLRGFPGVYTKCGASPGVAQPPLIAAKFKPAGHKITYVPLGRLGWATLTLGRDLLFSRALSQIFRHFRHFFDPRYARAEKMSKKSRQTLGKEKIPLQSHCLPLVTNISVHK